MSNFLRGNRNLMKAINRNLLLNIIRREGQISRTRLTIMSGLSTGAVSQIVNNLISRNWVLEVGKGESTGGRRQKLVCLNPRAGYAVGLKLMEDHVVVAATDFEARVLHYRDYPIDHHADPDDLCYALVAIIAGHIADAVIPRDKLFGLGIGLAGVIYPRAGVVHYSPVFGWRDVPLAELLSGRLKLPVYVENDVNTLTITEQLFGAGKRRENFVVVTVGRGIGMGMVINGQLYQGAKGGAGELGHILLDVNNGGGSTLEALASDPAVTRCLETADGAQMMTRTLEALVGRAQDGDDTARQLLARSGHLLGVGLATVINILSPELVIISGEGIQAGKWRLEPMFEAMRQHTFDGLLDDVEVVVEPTNDEAWARGAASVVISKVFESPLVEAWMEL